MSSVFDPGKKDRRRAASAADQAKISGGAFSGPGGIGGSFSFGGGQTSSESSLGSFAPTLEQLQSLSSFGFNQAQGGLPPEFQALGATTMDTLGAFDIRQLQNQSDFEGLGEIFQSSLGTAQADPFDLGAGISEKLRQLSERRNSRLVNKTFDRLKASGRLGTSGGAGIAAELEQNLVEQGLQFDLAGLQAGQGIQRDAFGRVMDSSQQREQIGSRFFNESMGMNQFAQNAALAQFGVGNSMFDSFLRNQQQGANIGFGATGAGMSLAQLPLAFQSANLAAAGTASDSLLRAAGIHGQNAANAKSPFLEALNAAGQFAGNIGVGVE